MRSLEQLAAQILVLRGQRAILDLHLAEIYGVATRRLNEQVRRNSGRFPAEFAFVLTNQEIANLKSQIATSSWGGKRKRPMVFSEHGAIMAATVLSSRRAISMSVFVVRVFVKMRDALAAHREIGRRLDELEGKVGTQDRAIMKIFDALRELTAPVKPVPRKRIGFVQDA
jgi:hypothetical protein